jgi:cytoskeleton protein RodZ
MNDDVDTRESTDTEPQGPYGGERLAEARRELKISVLEIAKELHLDEPKVRAIERNEFDLLGAPVFAKGHLKKYAQLVNVDPADVLTDYYKMHRSAEVPPVVSSRPRARRELSPGPWIAVIVVVIVLVSAYVWLIRPIELPTGTDEPAPVAEAPAPGDDLSTGAEEADDAAGNAPDAAPDASRDAAPETEAMPVPEETSIDEPVETTSSPGVAEGQVRVLLTYTGDCWTEISDATGRRLFFALGKDGRTVELSGAEPLNVLFGSPANVRVLVDGDEFALPETARPDRPLRLTLSGN